MGNPGKHALTAPSLPSGKRAERSWDRLRSPSRLGVTAAAAALVALGAMIAAVVVVNSDARPAGGGSTGPVPAPAKAAPSATANALPFMSRPGHQSVRGTGNATSLPAPAGGAVALVLTAADHRDCPAAVTACVDLTRHITWLQTQGRITFGPVQMEPGQPGGQHQTPRGRFQVQWKAGPDFRSNIYNEPMPWATFFAPGGIAFHGGSLTAWSHGCVHLTVANAHYYSEHLPVGAQVAVF
jgi:hypothetical protein